MNSIINFSLRNKLAIWLLTIIITVAGLYAGTNMKMETLPNINTPLITITTIYPGATPDEVADKVTEPIEQRVKNLKGTDVVSSTSFANASSIQIEYSYSTDMDEALAEAKEAVDKIKLPDGVQEPAISRLSLNAFPVISLSASAKGQSLADLTKLVEKELVPVLEGIEGVSSVTIAGQQVEEVQLTFDEAKLKEYGLTQETVTNIIKGSAVHMPLGLYTIDKEEKSVVLDGNILKLTDLQNLSIPLIPAQGQAPAAAVKPTATGLPTVQLKDIATVEVLSKAESISRTNGEQSIGIQVVKGADDNTVDVVNAVKKEMKQFEKDYKDVTLVTMFDQGEPIEESVNTMLNKAMVGAIFAVVIILLFLRDIKSTIISIVSIPLSLLIAVLFLKQMDISLNIMTLGAMTVAIGRVVDDSIVVIENIYRRLSLKEEKLRGMDLIREATREMFIPILSSTVVTIAVFLPLGLVSGPVGELFLPFALTVVFALSASLIVAVTVVPMLAHSLFKKEMKEGAKQHDKPSRIAMFYRGVLAWSLRHKVISFGMAVLLLVGSLFLVPSIGVSFLGSEEEKTIIATYNPAPGETEEDVQSMALNAEKYFQDKKDVKTLQYSVGGSNPMNPAATKQALFYVMYKDDTKEFSKEKETVLKDLQHIADKGQWGYQDMGSGGASNKLSLFVYGESRAVIEPVVSKITEIMKKDATFTNVDSSLAEAYDEYTLVANQDKLSKLGLTAGQIGMSLLQTGQQPVLTTIQKDGKELNVYVSVKKEDFGSITDVTNQTILSPLGIEVPLKEVVDVKEGKTSNTITKRDGRIYAEISADITTKDVAKASADLQKDVDALEKPKTVDVSFGGVTEQINESFKQLGLAMLAAIAIVYFVLVITFGGGLAPFAILFSLPFTVIGALVALLIAGETISVSALIGALMLIGIVVTNAIVLIDRVIQKEKEGLSTREALLEAAVTRVRPILMTAIATVGALIPLAIGAEGGGLISKGLGVTVIGGLISSTLLTLIIVPVVYEVLMKIRNRKRKQTA
ncbi:efflux RND transporter permease subunit [Ectobacillus sp. JY-23]|uniref:efflux RND transporter permease subunit n=1 Tax=Ectobacillus sp. JY-23 TaxID=2933872 RepID=UPI001FF60C68|nr:efflux RND transporter permease subunit [Ectobacillus sp. JY-23]UOY92987.1 efflux RND transporter permease subunit [Ectobacillus sp. JY-23]